MGNANGIKSSASLASYFYIWYVAVSWSTEGGDTAAASHVADGRVQSYCGREEGEVRHLIRKWKTRLHMLSWRGDMRITVTCTSQQCVIIESWCTCSNCHVTLVSHTLIVWYLIVIVWYLIAIVWYLIAISCTLRTIADNGYCLNNNNNWLIYTSLC